MFKTLLKNKQIVFKNKGQSEIRIVINNINKVIDSEKKEKNTIKITNLNRIDIQTALNTTFNKEYI